MSTSRETGKTNGSSRRGIDELCRDIRTLSAGRVRRRGGEGLSGFIGGRGRRCRRKER